MGLYEQVDYDFSGPLQPQDLFGREYVTMGGVIDHHLTTTMQSHIKMPKKPVVTTNNGLFPVLAANVQSQQNSRSIVGIHTYVVVLRPGRPEVRILPVAPRAAPYGVLLFLFCTDFMGQQKGGFDQPVPRALRPAGQKRPGGAFPGRGSAKPFGRTKNHLAMYFTQ